MGYYGPKVKTEDLQQHIEDLEHALAEAEKIDSRWANGLRQSVRWFKKRYETEVEHRLTLEGDPLG